MGRAWPGVWRKLPRLVRLLRRRCIYSELEGAHVADMTGLARTASAALTPGFWWEQVAGAGALRPVFQGGRTVSATSATLHQVNSSMATWLARNLRFARLRACACACTFFFSFFFFSFWRGQKIEDSFGGADIFISCSPNDGMGTAAELLEPREFASEPIIYEPESYSWRK